MKKKELPPVDLKNESECISLGIRNPKVSPRDPSVWTKSKKEKALIRKLKHSARENKIGWAAPQKESRFTNNLIIYVTKDNPKTTISIKDCMEVNVPYILGKYEDILVKAFFGGKQVYPNKNESIEKRKRNSWR